MTQTIDADRLDAGRQAEARDIAKCAGADPVAVDRLLADRDAWKARQRRRDTVVFVDRSNSGAVVTR